MNCFDDIKGYFNEDIRLAFDNLDDVIVSKITEIRIKRNRPIIIIIRNTTFFIDANGDIYDYLTHNALFCPTELFDDLFLKLCNYSIHSEMEAMKNGFISLNNGSRVGIASTCLLNDTGIITIKDVTSLNIRIANEHLGCSTNVLNFLYVNSFPSVIIAGPPNSGKTTLLRDLAYQLSNGFNGQYRKITIVDERNEICGKRNTDYLMTLGVNSDVLTGFNKSKGIEIATRTLSPEMIVCDEISSYKDFESISYAFTCGIRFALSVHCSSIDELKFKPLVKDLLNTKEFKYIVLLEKHSYKTRIIDVSELENEIYRNDANSDCINLPWDKHFNETKKKI